MSSYLASFFCSHVLNHPLGTFIKTLYATTPVYITNEYRKYRPNIVVRTTLINICYHTEIYNNVFMFRPACPLSPSILLFTSSFMYHTIIYCCDTRPEPLGLLLALFGYEFSCEMTTEVIYTPTSFGKLEDRPRNKSMMNDSCFIKILRRMTHSMK